MKSIMVYSSDLSRQRLTSVFVRCQCNVYLKIYSTTKFHLIFWTTRQYVMWQY